MEVDTGIEMFGNVHLNTMEPCDGFSFETRVQSEHFLGN